MNWLERLAASLISRMMTNMATQADLKAAMDAIQADFTAYQTTLVTEFATLAEQIKSMAAGVGPVTQAQLDDLTAQALVVDAAIKAAPVGPVPGAMSARKP